MKILKYIVFLSILTGIFFLIYRQSDQKGLRKLWISFKIAVLVAAIVAGLIPANTESVELDRNNHQVYQEQLVQDNDQKVILAKNSGEVDAFTVPIIKPDQSNKGFNGLFGTKKDNESYSKDNPDDDPNNPPFSNSEINSDFKGNKPESKEYEHQMYEKTSNQDTDSETDDESECSIDEVKIAVANDGTFINAEKYQVRDKGLHIPDFLDAETLDGKFNLTEAVSLLLTTLKTLPKKEVKSLIKNNFLKLSKRTLKQITKTEIDDLINVTFSDLPLEDRIHLLSIKLKGLFYGLTKYQAALLLIILAIFLRFNNCEAYFALCAALSSIFKSKTMKEFIVDSVKFTGFIKLVN